MVLSTRNGNFAVVGEGGIYNVMYKYNYLDKLEVTRVTEVTEVGKFGRPTLSLGNMM
jgi:hypothetical protein